MHWLSIGFWDASVAFRNGGRWQPQSLERSCYYFYRKITFFSSFFFFKKSHNKIKNM